MTSIETATNLRKPSNNPTQLTSLSILFPQTSFHLNNYQLNKRINLQPCNGMPMESTQNFLNCKADWLTWTWIMFSSKSLPSPQILVPRMSPPACWGLLLKILFDHPGNAPNWRHGDVPIWRPGELNLTGF